MTLNGGCPLPFIWGVSEFFMSVFLTLPRHSKAGLFGKQKTLRNVTPNFFESTIFSLNVKFHNGSGLKFALRTQILRGGIRGAISKYFVITRLFAHCTPGVIPHYVTYLVN